PGMGWFRVPARSLFLANLGGAVLAGLGIETLRAALREPRARRRLAVRMVGALVVVVVILFSIPLGPATGHPSGGRSPEGMARRTDRRPDLSSEHEMR